MIIQAECSTKQELQIIIIIFFFLNRNRVLIMNLIFIWVLFKILFLVLEMLWSSQILHYLTIFDYIWYIDRYKLFESMLISSSEFYGLCSELVIQKGDPKAAAILMWEKFSTFRLCESPAGTWRLWACLIFFLKAYRVFQSNLDYCNMMLLSTILG